MTATPIRKRSSAKRRYDGPTAEQKLCNELVEMIENGVNPWRKEWTAAASDCYQNLITGHHYRGANVLVLSAYMAARGYELPYFVGASQARPKGWFPKKGSKACYILRPQPVSYIKEDQDGNAVKDDQGKPVEVSYIKYKACAVFNVADLQAKDDKAQAALDAKILELAGNSTAPKPLADRNEAARTQLEKWVVDVKHYGDRAFYSPSADKITMPKETAFTSEGAYLSTLSHEMIHSTGHGRRLGRDLSGRFGSKSYAREELVAELGAFLVCNRLEIDSNTNNHAAYLKGWAQILGDDDGPRVLFKVLSDATKAAELIAPQATDEA